MDQSIQVQNYIAMQVIDCLCCKFTTHFLDFLNMVETITFEQLLLEQLCLLIEVIFLNLAHKGLDPLFFVLDEVIQGYFHPHEHGVNISSFLLNPHILLSIQKVVFLFKLIPQFITPFGHNSQDGRVLNSQFSLIYLIRRVGRHIF